MDMKRSRELQIDCSPNIRALVLIDIFEDIEDFFDYLKSIPFVKEIYKIVASFKTYNETLKDHSEDKMYDREVVVRITASNRNELESVIKKIRRYPKVKDLDVLRMNGK